MADSTWLKNMNALRGPVVVRILQNRTPRKIAKGKIKICAMKANQDKGLFLTGKHLDWMVEMSGPVLLIQRLQSSPSRVLPHMKSLSSEILEGSVTKKYDEVG